MCILVAFCYCFVLKLCVDRNKLDVNFGERERQLESVEAFSMAVISRLASALLLCNGSSGSVLRASN